jgi:hypothetical protein
MYLITDKYCESTFLLSIFVVLLTFSCQYHLSLSVLQEEKRVNVELTSSCQYRLSSSVLQEEQRVTFELISSCQYRLSSE